MGQAFPALPGAAQHSSISSHPKSQQGRASMPGDSEQGLEREILPFKPRICLCSSYLFYASNCQKDNTSPGTAIEAL